VTNAWLAGGVVELLSAGAELGCDGEGAHCDYVVDGMTSRMFLVIVFEDHRLSLVAALLYGKSFSFHKVCGS
jgi:hypothetical protein